VSAGAYDAFKQVAEPTAAAYSDRFEGVSVRLDEGTYFADLDSDATEESFGNPNFSFKQFRSNAVLRWEYLPGSALFLVWSQGRDGFDRNGDFDFAGDVGDLFELAPQNVFMVKFSYWMSR